MLQALYLVRRAGTISIDVWLQGGLQSTRAVEIWTMFFIHPMWDSESERIGKQKCTPIGYAIHGVADLLGFVALLLLMAILIYLAYREGVGTFSAPLLWWLAGPFGIGFISEVLYQYSWMLARRKDFQYDYERREASWMEAGQRCSYKWER